MEPIFTSLSLNQNVESVMTVILHQTLLGFSFTVTEIFEYSTEVKQTNKQIKNYII